MGSCILFVLLLDALLATRAYANPPPKAPPADQRAQPSSPQHASAPAQPLQDRARAPLNHGLSLSGLWHPRDVGTGFGARLAYQYALVWPAAVDLADSLQDDLALEVDLSFSRHRWQLAEGEPPFTQQRWSLNLSALWNVWFSSHLGVYAKMGLGYRLGVIQPEGTYGERALTGPQGTIGLGAYYRVRALALRLELSSRALGLGLTYTLL